MEDPSSRGGLYGQRASRSHDAVRQREFARLAAMTARERMIEALALGDELGELLETQRPPEGEASQDRDE